MDKSIRIRKPIKLWDILKIILAIVLLVYVASRTNFSQLLALRTRFLWGWFGITFLLFSTMIAAKAAQYYYLLSKKVPYYRVLEIVVLQNALMNFVATAAGIASYLTMLGAEKNVRLGRATVSFVVVKMVDLVAVLFFFMGSILLLRPLPDEVIRITIIIAIAAILILAFFFSAVLFRRGFAEFLRKTASILRLDKIDFIQKGLDLLDNLAGQNQGKIFRLVLSAAMLSFIYMALSMAWGYTRIRMFSLDIDIATTTFVHSSLQIASWIPVYVLGGLGVSETLSVYLFGLFGENPVEMAAIMIGVRLVFYIMNGFSLIYLPIETIVHTNLQKGNNV